MQGENQQPTAPGYPLREAHKEFRADRIGMDLTAGRRHDKTIADRYILNPLSAAPQAGGRLRGRRKNNRRYISDIPKIVF